MSHENGNGEVSKKVKGIVFVVERLLLLALRQKNSYRELIYFGKFFGVDFSVRVGKMSVSRHEREIERERRRRGDREERKRCLPSWTMQVRFTQFTKVSIRAFLFVGIKLHNKDVNLKRYRRVGERERLTYLFFP